MINREEMKKAIDRLGIAGKEVCIHSSIKSFGDEIEGGIDSIIHAFLEKDCTIMAPAFSYAYAQRPVKEYMPERNGINYKEALEMPCDKELIYSTDSKYMTDEHMGALPRHILEFPESVRGNHPVNSFTAVGRKAEELLAGQAPSAVYAPFEYLCDYDGYVLLMGVGLDRATIIHYAEQMAGRKPFVRWANDSTGHVIPVMAGSCSGGFCHLEKVLKDKRQVMIGNSLWQCYQAKELVRLCTKAILEEPQITHCDNPDCERCRDAILGGPFFCF